MDIESSFACARTQKERKDLWKTLLLGGDLETTARWGVEHREVGRLLNSLLYDAEGLVRWRAIQVFGLIAALKAGVRIESVREMLRRLVWAVNDESGNSIPHAPELIGEILANVPILIPEFARYLLACHDSPLYERGISWAMARIAAVDPEAFREFSEMLTASLNDADPQVRGLALRALSPNAVRDALPLIRSLRFDPAIVRYYDPACGNFQERTVEEIADSVLASLK